MNWFYDCIFQGVWKNRIGNAVIIVFKNKISKNIIIFLNNFSGYVCALRGFICLKVLNFFHDFITFSLGETKRQTRVTIFLYSNYARVEPIFHDCFHHWITYAMTDLFHLYWGILSVVMIRENSFKIYAVFLSFTIILSSSTRVILSL